MQGTVDRLACLALFFFGFIPILDDGLYQNTATCRLTNERPTEWLVSFSDQLVHCICQLSVRDGRNRAIQNDLVHAVTGSRLAFGVPSAPTAG